jgi:hypothetical protein
MVWPQTPHIHLCFTPFRSSLPQTLYGKQRIGSMPPTISDKLRATRVNEFSQKSDRDKSSHPEDSSRTWRAGNAKSMRNVCPLCASFRSACALAPFFGRASRERLFSAREVNTDCCKAQIGSQQRQGF